jgi:hypothetical protein
LLFLGDGPHEYCGLLSQPVNTFGLKKRRPGLSFWESQQVSRGVGTLLSAVLLLSPKWEFRIVSSGQESWPFSRVLPRDHLQFDRPCAAIGGIGFSEDTL